jgi:sugar phosphate isomerase/epimerase
MRAAKCDDRRAHDGRQNSVDQPRHGAAAIRSASSAAACAKYGIAYVAPWRDQVIKTGLDRTSALIEDHGLRMNGLCRGGLFPAGDRLARTAAIDDNRQAVDEAVALGAECLVVVVGGLADKCRELAAARDMVAEGLMALLPHARANKMPLGIEPLHPMYAADPPV